MMPPEATSRCPLCGGAKAPGTTTYTVDLGAGLVVVRDVPAMVCERCGGERVDDETAARLEGIVEGARRHRPQVAIVALG